MTKKYLSSYKKAPGTVLLLHSALVLILHVFWSVLSGSDFGFLTGGLRGYVFSAFLMQGICMLFPVVFVVYLLKLPSGIVVGTTENPGPKLFLSILAGIPAAVVFIGLNNGFIYLMSLAGFSLTPSLLPSRIAFDGSGTLIVAVLVSAFLPGISEELMFRGVIQGFMETAGNKFSGVFFTALAFSLFHSDPLFILAPFLAGLFLGFLRSKSGSIYCSVLAHISMNLTILFISPILPRIAFEYLTVEIPDASLYASLLAAAVASVALLPILIVFSSMCHEKKTKKPTSGIFPFDFKYVLALVILAANLLYVYYR